MDLIERSYQGLVYAKTYRRTWAFPNEVAELLQRETAGGSVLHLFGGMAAWGVRLDVDRSVRPAAIGNAFYPPFRCESFDAVVCDPPYFRQPRTWLLSLIPAACLARRTVWWFSSDVLWANTTYLRLRRWWIVVPGRHAVPRYLVDMERVRHPRRCRPPDRIAGRRWATPARQWNWSSYLH